MEEQLFDELWEVEQRHWWFVGRRRVVVSLVDRYAPQPTESCWRICELGCGTGGNLAHWSDDHEVFGMDVSPKALEYAEQRVGARVELGQLPHDVPFAKDAFDIVLMTDVLEHIEDDRGSAEAAYRLLRPGGVLVATVPAHQWLYSPRDKHHHHFRRYAKSQLRRVLDQDDVQIELLSYYNSALFLPAAVVRMRSKLLGQEVDAGGDISIPPAPLNALLANVFAGERHLLGRLPLPPGLSLVAVVRKRDTQPQSLPNAA